VEARHRFGAQSQRASDGSGIGVRHSRSARDGSALGAHVLRSLGLLAIAIGVLLALSAAAVLAAPPAQFGGPSGSGAGEFSEPFGIAVDQQSADTYIADRNNDRVDKFGPAGEFLLAWGWGVADGTTAAPQTCTATCFGGEEVPFAGSGVGQFEAPAGIAVDNDPASSSRGDVYVLDLRNHRVQKFGPSGEFLLMLGGGVDQGPNHPGNLCTAAFIAGGDTCGPGASGSGPGEFVAFEHNAIAVDSSGSLYVGDENRVQRFAADGTLEAQISLPGVGFPNSLAVDSVGDLYLTSFSGLGVHKYDQAGNELGEPRDALGNPSAIAVGPAPTDQLFVNDEGEGEEHHHLLAYDSSGVQISSFDPVTGFGKGAENGLAFATSGSAALLYALGQQSVRTISPPPPGPLVISQSAGEIQPTTATLGAILNAEGAATGYRFEYGTSASYGETTPSAPPLEPVDEVQTVTLKATSGSYLLSFRGESTVEIPFDAEASEVQADLEAVSTIGAGNVSASGPSEGPYAIEFVAALGAAEQPLFEARPGSLKETTEVEGEERTKPGAASVATTRPGAGFFTDRPVSASITGLAPGTTYHYRVTATNSDGTVEGPDQTFTTPTPVSIDSLSATGVSATSATLEAQLNPHGLESEYRFEYDTVPYAQGEGPHGVSVPAPEGRTGSGLVDVIRSAPAQGLLPGTVYYYRVVAHNPLGGAESEARQFKTQVAGTSLLPDGRAWELVSPPNKHGSPLEPITEEGGDIQASADGGRLAYVSKGPVGAEPPGVRAPHANQLIASRGSGGWASQDITTPYESIAVLYAGEPSEYRLFSQDLSVGVVEPQGSTPLSPQTSERSPYLRSDFVGSGFCTDACFSPLVTACPELTQICRPAVQAAANVPPGTKFGGTEEPPVGSGKYVKGSGVEFIAASPDLARIVVTSPEDLTPGYEGLGRHNLYELSGGSLRPISILPDEEDTGASLGSGTGLSKRGAISTEANRVAFTAEGHLYLRDLDLGKTVQLDASQGGSGPAGHTVFQGANRDGSRVFFTDDARLTGNSTARPEQPDLYMCQITVVSGEPVCALVDLTVSLNHGEAADVAGPNPGEGRVSAVDASGTNVFFAASGVLTTAPNGRGEHAVPGNCGKQAKAPCNLYVVNAISHQVRLVAVLTGADAADWGSGGGREIAGLTSRVSPDGRYFAFMSQSSLTGYDNHDARSGELDEEVFLFDADSGALSCVSCNPTGARPLGVLDPEAFPGLLVDHPGSWHGHWLAASIPGWTATSLVGQNAQFQSRYLDDSGRLFFTSSDALVPQDSNGVMDVYEYEPPGLGSCTVQSRTYGQASGGCVDLISSGTSSEESAFLDASESGDDVFFLTASKLVQQDVDSAADVYDARVGGSSAEPATAVECTGDACQQPASPPAHPTPGTVLLNGPGNVIQCPKGKVKQKGKCVKKHKAGKPKQKDQKKHKHSHKKNKGKKQSQANSKRGGQK
jgi:hypothetical protein